MEGKGLVIPVHIDERSGYCYYDNHNINKILQIRAFQKKGLSYDDISEFSSSGGSSSGLVAPYMGREIDPDKFVSRYILPVKE